MYGERKGRQRAAAIRRGISSEKTARENNMKTLLTAVYSSVIAAVLFSGSALLVGCHTAEGVGKDTKSVGNAVEDAAKDARK